MIISISTLLCLFYLWVNCSAVSSKWNTMYVEAIQELSEKLNLLEQRLTREHSRLHGVRGASLSNVNSNEINERWVRDMENRVDILENTILQNHCYKKIQSLEKTVHELSKQVKQQAQYNERTEKLEAIVKDQEKTIYELKEKVNKIQKNDNEYRDIFVAIENENDKDRNMEDDAHNQTRISQRIRSPAASSDLRKSVFNKKRLLSPTTFQPVTNPTIIAFYAYMATQTPSITIQHPLVFDVVKTNNGNAYHSTTGVFSAPETGVYVFTWTIREHSNCYHSTQLMVNNAELGIIHVRTATNSGGDIAGTGIVVTQVNRGDDVYVRTHHGMTVTYLAVWQEDRPLQAGSSLKDNSQIKQKR